MQIDRPGTFRVKEIDRALGTTPKQGLPQLVVRVAILEYYDAQEEAWADFSECDMETTAYFILMHDGEKGLQTSLSYDQLMKVYGWDGKSFETLTTMDVPEVFLIRVEDNDPKWADKNPFVVKWIDDKDADPRGGLKKLDAKGVKDLQAKFGAVLKKSGKAAVPATAKKAPPVAPKKANLHQVSTLQGRVRLTPEAIKKTAVAAAAALTPEAIKEAMNEVPATSKTKKQTKSERVKEANEKLRKEVANRANATFPPDSPTPVDEQAKEHRDGMTKEEAWWFVIDMGDEACTDEQRAAAWQAAAQEIAGEVDEKEITPQQWHEICHKTLDDTGTI